MGIENINLKNSQLICKTQSPKTVQTQPNFRGNDFERTPETDMVEFSNSSNNNTTKWVIGSLIALAGIGIAGRYGAFGQSVKEFLGGAKKAVEQEVKKPTEQTKEEVKKTFKEIYNDAIKNKKETVEDTLNNRTHRFEYDNDGKVIKEIITKGDDVAEKTIVDGKLKLTKLTKNGKTTTKEEAQQKLQEAKDEAKKLAEEARKAEQAAKEQAAKEAAENAFIETNKPKVIEMMTKEAEALWKELTEGYGKLAKNSYFLHEAGFAKIKGNIEVLEDGSKRIVKKHKNTTTEFISKDGKSLTSIIKVKNGVKTEITFLEKQPGQQGQCLEMRVFDDNNNLQKVISSTNGEIIGCRYIKKGSIFDDQISLIEGGTYRKDGLIITNYKNDKWYRSPSIDAYATGEKISFAERIKRYLNIE